MTDIRSLRLRHGLTLIDLARLTGIPARTLAELEYGMRRFDHESQARLSQVFDVPPDSLQSASAQRQSAADSRAAWIKNSLFTVVAAMIGIAFLMAPALEQPLSASAAPPSTAERAAPAAPSAASRASRPAALRPSAPAQPSATLQPAATPRFTLAADGPHGCPLAPATGHVVMTQGYNEGSHMPTNVWGAVDLAIDGDGDGNAEPATTAGVPIAVTLGGIAHVFLGSWPGGNYVRVAGEQPGWSTAYAHLDQVAVTDGQALETGATIGTVGSTGMASGPHLHYEIWHGGENVDPSGLISCR